MNTIKERHLRLVIPNSVTIDCRNGDTDPMSMAFLQMAGVFLELELSMIRARVRSGMLEEEFPAPAWRVCSALVRHKSSEDSERNITDNVGNPLRY